jgi:hypothetical protein
MGPVASQIMLEIQQNLLCLAGFDPPPPQAFNCFASSVAGWMLLFSGENEENPACLTTGKWPE